MDATELPVTGEGFRGLVGEGMDVDPNDLLDGSGDEVQMAFRLGIGVLVAGLALTWLCLIICGLKQFLKKRKQRRFVVPEKAVSATANQAKSIRPEYVAIWIEDEVEEQTDKSWTTVSSEQEDCSIIWTKKEEFKAEMKQMLGLPTGQMSIFNEFIEEQAHSMEQRPSHTIVSMGMNAEENPRPCLDGLNENKLDDYKRQEVYGFESTEQEFYQLTEESSSAASLDAENDDELPGRIEVVVPMDRQMVDQWVTIEMEEDIDIEDTTGLIASPSVMWNVGGNEGTLHTENAGLEIPSAPIRWNVEDDEHMSEYEMNQFEKQQGHIEISVDRNNPEIYQDEAFSMGIQGEEVDYRMHEEVQNIEDYDSELSDENDTEEHQEILAPLSWNIEHYYTTNGYERKAGDRANEDKNQDGNISIVLDVNDDEVIEDEPMVQATENEEEEDNNDDHDYRMEEETQNIREDYYDHETPEEENVEENYPKIPHSIMESTGATGSSSEASIPITVIGDQMNKNKPLSVIKYTFPAFDLNTNDDTSLAYVLTSDDDDQLAHPSEASDPELIAIAQTWDAIVVESDENSDQDRLVSSPVQQDRLTSRQLLEGEPVDPAEKNVNASDTATSTWRRALNFDSNLLDYAQAEGGWMRKKVDHYDMGTSHETELPNTDDVFGLGPGILTTILEPLNRFVTSLISPDESRMILIEPDQAPSLDVDDYNDRDEDSIRAEMTRLTRPRNPPGIISYLDFCQAEGSAHSPRPNDNKIPATFSLRHGALNSSARIDDTEVPPPPTDEELEKEEQEEYAKLDYLFGIAGSELNLPADTETNEAESEEKPNELEQKVETEPDARNEITTDTPNDLDAVTIQADMSSLPTTSPRNVRQTMTAGGIPLELNINLTLQSCCHHASGTKDNCRSNEIMTSTRDTSPPGRQSLDPTESRGFQPSATKVSIGTLTETCPCARTARDVVLCETDNPEQRVYGLTSMLDFMQAEGSPYAHEDGRGGMNIGSQLASWWDTAVRAA